MIRETIMGALVVAVLLLGTLAGVFAYRFKDASGQLDKLQTTNDLYARTIDRLTAQRKIDDKTVAAFNEGLANLNAKADETADAVKSLSDDPQSKPYMQSPLPDNVKRLLNR